MVRRRIRIRSEQTVERTWKCARCGASAEVALRGSAQTEWRDDHAWRDVASELVEQAHWGVQRDVTRMLGMIRCPECHERAPRAVLWSVVRPVPPAVIAAAGTWLALSMSEIKHRAWIDSLAGTLVVVAVFVGMLALGARTEARRWRSAGAARLTRLRPGPAERSLPRAIARVVEPPAPPAPAPVAPITTAAPEVVEQATDASGPRFLGD